MLGRQRDGPAVEREAQTGGRAHEEIEAAAGDRVRLPRFHGPRQAELAGAAVVPHLDVRPPADAAQDELAGGLPNASGSS